jgi:hypothetical protein
MWFMSCIGLCTAYIILCQVFLQCIFGMTPASGDLLWSWLAHNQKAKKHPSQVDLESRQEYVSTGAQHRRGTSVSHMAERMFGKAAQFTSGLYSKMGRSGSLSLEADCTESGSGVLMIRQCLSCLC